MAFSPAVDALIEAFRVLPGVGPKSAQRMALYLLEHHTDAGLALGQQLTETLEKIQRCERCRTLTETPICQICAQSSRMYQLLCVVESPADIYAIEQTGVYRGLYFVLSGRLSPIDGMGPDEIGVPLLKERLATGDTEELILATSPTVEGQATAYYLSELGTAAGVRVSQLAQGIPRGSELEYIDGMTLAGALSNRQIVT